MQIISQKTINSKSSVLLILYSISGSVKLTAWPTCRDKCRQSGAEKQSSHHAELAAALTLESESLAREHTLGPITHTETHIKYNCTDLTSGLRTQGGGGLAPQWLDHSPQ